MNRVLKKLIDLGEIPKKDILSLRFASNLNKKYSNRKCHAVCESTANMWLKTYEAFEKNGIDIKLANPMKTKAIAEARIKTDKLDARILAHLLRFDLIAESYIAPDKVREDRSLLRLRINLVSDRTRVMNRENPYRISMIRNASFTTYLV